MFQSGKLTRPTRVPSSRQPAKLKEQGSKSKSSTGSGWCTVAGSRLRWPGAVVVASSRLASWLASWLSDQAPVLGGRLRKEPGWLEPQLKSGSVALLAFGVLLRTLGDLRLLAGARGGLLAAGQSPGSPLSPFALRPSPRPNARPRARVSSAAPRLCASNTAAASGPTCRRGCTGSPRSRSGASGA